MNPDDRLVARLLAGRDRLSRSEKDELLDRALASAAPRPRGRWPWLAVPALAATVALVVLAPWRSSSPELAARGTTRAFATLHVTCSPACTQGGKLVFDLHGTTGYRYLAAFAKRDDGTVLWYFPSADDATSADLSTLASTGVLDSTVVLGPEHRAGTYRIIGLFSNAPLTRAAIRAAFDPVGVTAGSDREVVTADLEVH